MSQPSIEASPASSMSISDRTSAWSKTIASCGSHSAPPSTRNAMCCDAQRPLALYHLVAPGVVISAWAPGCTATSIDNASPPAMPPGGWISNVWHSDSPSG